MKVTVANSSGSVGWEVEPGQFVSQPSKFFMRTWRVDRIAAAWASVRGTDPVHNSSVALCKVNHTLWLASATRRLFGRVALCDGRWGALWVDRRGIEDHIRLITMQANGCALSILQRGRTRIALRSEIDE